MSLHRRATRALELMPVVAMATTGQTIPAMSSRSLIRIQWKRRRSMRLLPLQIWPSILAHPILARTRSRWWRVLVFCQEVRPSPWLRIDTGALGQWSCGLRRPIRHWASLASTSSIGGHFVEVSDAATLTDTECHRATFKILLCC
jgi:hypothetical protein